MLKYLLLFKIFLFYAFIQAQNNEPILILNTEMHTAKINRVDTDAAGKYIVTSSKDKTAKLWSTETGKLLQTNEMNAIFIFDYSFQRGIKI